ncbi:MAG: hypothetical protein ACRCWQ_10770 [Bacilli bacterium]
MKRNIGTQGKFAAIDATGRSIEFVDLPLQPIVDDITALQDADVQLSSRVDGVETKVSDLENKPNPAYKFIELSDTPGGYQPGKLVGYNLSGDALIAYENRDEFSKLKDTPSTYTGQATKVLTVKTDESGLEFTNYPNVGQIIPRIDDLETRATDLENTTIDLSTTVDDTVSRVDVLERKPDPEYSFNDLTDTPGGYQPGQLIGYNLAGDALMAYDRRDALTDLTDTPDAYLGQSTKVLTVKTDESGLEFTDYPPVANIQDQLNDHGYRINIIEPDLSDARIRITALETSPTTFKDLSDTPSDFTGQARKTLTVNDSEDGFEFAPFPNVGNLEYRVDRVETDVTGLNDRADTLETDVSALIDTTDTIETEVGVIGPGLLKLNTDLLSGNQPLKHKSLGAALRLTGAAIFPIAFVAAAPIVFSSRTGDSTMVLPKIVGEDSTVLAADEVRNGTIIRIVKIGTGKLTITPSAGHFINRANVNYDSHIVPLNEIHTFMSGTYANGNKCWMYVEADSHTYDDEISPTKLKASIVGLSTGETPIGNRGISSGVIESTFNMQDYSVAMNDHIICRHTGTAQGRVFMPEIVDYDVVSLTNTQVRTGRVTRVYNYGTNEIALRNGKIVEKDGTENSDYTLAPGEFVELFPTSGSSNPRWILLFKQTCL